MPARRKTNSDTIRVSREELRDILGELIGSHDPCPLGMSEDSVAAANKLVEIIPSLAKLAEHTPDLAKVAKNAENIVAVAKLYGEGRKTVSTTIKAIIILGLITVLITGIIDKLKSLLPNK